MVRPPRQTCHRKGSAQIVTTGMIVTTGRKPGTSDKSRASTMGVRVGRDLCKVSFNDAVKCLIGRHFFTYRHRHRNGCLYTIKHTWDQTSMQWGR